MKIMLVVGNYFPESCGGTQVFTQVLAEALNHAGHDVSVLCMGDNDKDEIINGVKVYRMKVVQIEKWTKNKLVYFINKCLHMYNPFNAKKLIPILKKEQPDILHLQMARMISPSVLSVAHKMNIKTIHTLHELFSLWNFNPFIQKDIANILSTKPGIIVRIFKEIHKNISHSVSAVTAPSNFALKQYLREGYFRSVKKRIIPNAIPFNIEEVNRIYKIKQQKLGTTIKVKFLYIGRLDHYKGLELILSEFTKLKDLNIELIIAGIGTLESLVKEYCEKDSRIKYRGFVYGSEKDELFSEANVLLFPSTYYETFGLVILEAYIHGLVVIGSNIGAVPDLVSHSKTGYLIPPNDSSALSNAIKHFSHPENILSLLDNCKEELRKYDFKEFIKRYEELYREVLEK